MATDKKRGLLTEQLLTDAASSKKELPSSENVTEEEIQELIEELDSGENIENLEAVVFKKLENGNYTDSIIDEYRQKLNEAKNSDIPTSDKEKMYKDIHRKFLENSKNLLNYIKNSPERVVEEDIKPETDTDKAVKSFFNKLLEIKKQKVDPNIYWMSHEGSTIVCALISISENGSTYISLSQLPEVDRILVNRILQKRNCKQCASKGFSVQFDEYKNFVFVASISITENEVFTMGNRVASIPPHESSKFGVDVKVERRGKDVVIGDRIVVDKSKFQNFGGGEPALNGSINNNKELQKKQRVSGRNAFELRSDLIEMAMDLLFHNNKNDKISPEEVVETARTLYIFVENK